ncbi:MAG: hypothetical protein R6W89_05535 [Candidatus Hydrogenedentota bacterium]
MVGSVLTAAGVIFAVLVGWLGVQYAAARCRAASGDETEGADLSETCHRCTLSALCRGDLDGDE